MKVVGFLLALVVVGVLIVGFILNGFNISKTFSWIGNGFSVEPNETDELLEEFLEENGLSGTWTQLDSQQDDMTETWSLVWTWSGTWDNFWEEFFGEDGWPEVSNMNPYDELLQERLNHYKAFKRWDTHTSADEVEDMLEDDSMEPAMPLPEENEITGIDNLIEDIVEEETPVDTSSAIDESNTSLIDESFTADEDDTQTNDQTEEDVVEEEIINQDPIEEEPIEDEFGPIGAIEG